MTTDVKEYLKDKILIERCNKFTRDMLGAGMDINRICMFVKDYQKKYIEVKERGGEEFAKLFTFELWWKSSQTEDGKFKLAI